MKYLRTILGTLILATAVAGLLSVGALAAGATGPGTHVTDGTEDYTDQPFCEPITGSVCGPEGLGPPTDTPHFETIDGVSNLCIDPPTFTDITFHPNTGDSYTFNYQTDTGLIFHGAAHTCIPWEKPVCVDEQTDVHFDLYATWNIGSGQSGHVTVDIDCTPEPPVVEPPVVVPPAPIVPEVSTPEAAPPATPVVRDPGELAFTGTGEDLAMAGFALAIITIGIAAQMTPGSRARRASRGLR